jgi:hypothetical protein
LILQRCPERNLIGRGSWLRPANSPSYSATCQHPTIC